MPAHDPSGFGRDCEIRVDDACVRVFNAGTDELIWQIGWEDIDEIIVWKDDVYAYDIICMGFAWAGSDVLKVVDEETVGWRLLQSAIETRFNVRYHDWWDDVAFPPFAEQRRVIWKRSTPA